MTERSDRNRVLDGYRAVAALAVLTTHVAFQSGAVAEGRPGAVLARLDIGVALFFVLSGYLLFRSYARGQLSGSTAPSLGRYLRHRGTRILPGYWVVVVIALATTAASYRSRGELLTQTLLLQTFTQGHLLPGLTQTWSLATEVCFYLLLPGYAALLARWPARDLHARLRVQLVGLAVLAAATPAWTYWVLGTGALDARVAMLWLPAHLDWFAAGMLVAVLREYETLRPTAADEPATWWRTIAASPGACWGGAAALLLIASTPVAGPLTLDATTALHAATKELLYLAIALLLLIAGVWPSTDSLAVRFFSSRPVQAVGRWSYGLFLWHLLALALVAWLLDRETFDGGFWLLLPLTTVLGLAFAAASWTIVERPAQRWREAREQAAQQRAERH